MRTRNSYVVSIFKWVRLVEVLVIQSQGPQLYSDGFERFSLHLVEASPALDL